MTADGDARDTARIEGGCLCGKVRYTAVRREDVIGACHCKMCQRWSGGVYLHLKVSDLELARRDGLGAYHASAWGERLFCRECGSSIAWRKRDGSEAEVAVGTIDGTAADLLLTKESFFEEKPAGYRFAGETEKFSGDEILARDDLRNDEL